MSRFECKTKLPVQMDPLRLQSRVLQGASILPSGLSMTAYPVRSSTTDSLLKKHQDLLNSAKTLGTFSTVSFSASKRGGLSQRGAPPVKKVKNIETTVTTKQSKALKEVEKPLKRSSAKKAEPLFESKTIVDGDDVSKEKIYSEISYDNTFEKMEVEEKWECDFGLVSVRNELDEASQYKKSILNLFNQTLVDPQDFRKKDLELRDVFLKHLDGLSQADPEFVLKLSLYGRKHLNVRSTSNFLVAFAANNDRCKLFLPKYYSSVVILPSDWIEIAEFALTLGRGDKSVLPTSLRRVMAKKFPEFDKYQLAKYNKDKTKNQKRRAKKKAKREQESTAKGNDRSKNGGRRGEWKSKPKQGSSVDDAPQHFTLKQLVRKLHISEPVDSVMELIGKKYPETMEAFFQSRLPGLYDEERAGKRMKLPTPETWETQVSLKGNKAHVWEELLDHRKLPFMAMLRNLRNLIFAKISDKHHELILGKLTNENAVINSKQFPFRFFSAYSVLDDLTKGQEEREFKMNKVVKKRKVKVVKKYKYPKKTASVRNLEPLVTRYRTALDKAVKISTSYNVPPIPGRSLILCDLSDKYAIKKDCTSARSLGGKRSVGEMAVLLSLMCKYSCEESRLLVCGSATFEEVQVDHKSSILENTKRLLELESVINTEKEEEDSSSYGNDEFSYLVDLTNKLIHNREKIDRWIVVGGECETLVKTLSPKLSEFKQAVNPDILAYHVDPSSKSNSRYNNSSLEFTRLFGFTEQVLRYIAEESDKGQLTFVENIDRLYKLENPKHLEDMKGIPDIPMALGDKTTKTPKWSICRIFISSTFLDMFSERDLLVKYIFQELKVRARSLFVDIFEVDLRWGITEEQSQNNETIHLCLSEVMKCQFFVGMLGERYGWCPEDYGGLSSYPGLEWIEKHPKGSSVTELEFHQCFRSLDVKNRAFFYFRDSQFLKNVPEKQKHLVTDNKEQKLKALKRFVANSGAEVYDDYPCQWGGIDGNGKARVVDLEEFGKRVLDNLWNAIQKVYSKTEDDESDSSTKEDTDKDLHLSYADFLNSRFVGRQNLVNNFLELLATRKTGVVLMTGKPGSGKSALMASVYRHWMEAGGDKKVLIHCVGASPGSDDVVRMMTRFCRELEGLCQFSVGKENASLELSSKMFQECLKSASAKGGLPIHVFVDGVDSFSDEHQARLMSWLPQNIPKGVLFVVSTNENSESHVALKNRPLLVGSVDVGVLSLPDRQAIVREKLKSYSKMLDESAFNNQMKLISTKKESTSPLYLSLVCEEMRQFGDFEKVNSKLASLPPTLSKLMQNFIEDLERTHGESFARTALCCLVYSKHGLKEHELQELLSRAFLVQSESQMENFKEECWQDLNPDNFISPSSVLLFVRGAQGLLRPNSLDESGEAVMTIGHKEVVDAIRRRYTSNLTGKKYEKFIHTLLTSYFYHAIDPNIDGNWKTADRRVAASFLYHMVQSCDFDLLGAVLTNLSFVQYCFKRALSKELLEAYQVPVPTSATLKKEYESSIGSSRFKEYKSFVFRNAHQLSQYPQLTFQQSLLEPDDTSVAMDCEEYLTDTPEYRVPYAKWLNKHHFKDLCVQSVDAKRSSCLALSSDEKLLAVGFETAVVKLYDVGDFKVKSTLIGHSGCITGVCFVSNFRLCSSSRDETLSLWDINGGYRLAVMEGHRRAVTSCVADGLGRIVVSVGLDALINVWHGVTGALETTLPRDVRPINCLSLHPEGQSVVTGSWDSILKIWDIVQKKKTAVFRAVFRGHSGSVQGVKFSRSGIHVASVDIFGEIRIWSADHAKIVGILKSPSDDLFTQIFYSPSGAELLTSSSSGTVKVLSSTMGHCINVFTDESHTQATCVTFDPTPLTLMPDVVVGYHSGSVRMFSCTSGDQVWELVHQGPPVAITCSSFLIHGEKKFVVVGKADGTCQMLSSKNGHLVSTLIGHSSPVAGVVCSKDDLITAGDNFINMHNLEDALKQSIGTPHKPCVTIEGHKNLITGIALSPKGNLLASVGRDRAIVIWEMDSPLQVEEEFEEAHMDWITCCSWSDQADYLVTGSNDFLVKVWDVKEAQLKHVLTGHNSMVTGVSFKYGCIVSSSADGGLKVWSHMGVYLSSLMAPHSKCNSCDLFVSLSDDEGDKRTTYKNWDDEVTASKVRGERSGKKPRAKVIAVASCYDDGTTRIWNPVEADEKHLLIGHKNKVTALTVGHHGLVCTTSSDGLLKAWRVPSTPKGRDPPNDGQNSSSVSCLVVSPDGTMVCAGTSGGSVKLWLRRDVVVSADALSRPKLTVGTARVACLHFISGTLVALASDDLQLSLWQLQCRRNELSLSCLKSVTCDHPITSMASLSSHGSSHLVTVHLKGYLRLWRVSTDGGVDIEPKDSAELFDLQFFGMHVPEGDKLKSYLFGCKGVRVYRVEVHKGSTISANFLSAGHGFFSASYGLFSACGFSDKILFCGSAGGLLHGSKGIPRGLGREDSGSNSSDVGEFSGKLNVRIHDDKITGLVTFDDVVVTCSLDGYIKAFDVIKRTVIGQFQTPFRITSMVKVNFEEGRDLGLKLLCGTESGTVVCVEWVNTNRK